MWNLVYICLIFYWNNRNVTLRYDFSTDLARVRGVAMISKMSTFQIFPIKVRGGRGRQISYRVTSSLKEYITERSVYILGTESQYRTGGREAGRVGANWLFVGANWLNVGGKWLNVGAKWLIGRKYWILPHLITSSGLIIWELVQLGWNRRGRWWARRRGGRIPSQLYQLPDYQASGGD